MGSLQKNSCLGLTKYFIGGVTYIFVLFNIKEFVTTLTLLRAIAPPAIIGDSSQPVKGYKIPAAIGIPRTL